LANNGEIVDLGIFMVELVGLGIKLQSNSSSQFWLVSSFGFRFEHVLVALGIFGFGSLFTRMAGPTGSGCHFHGRSHCSFRLWPLLAAMAGHAMEVAALIYLEFDG